MSKLVLAAVMLAAAAPAFADDWDFVLINASGKVIQTVELAPAGSTTWQPNQVDPDFGRRSPTEAADRRKAGGR